MRIMITGGAGFQGSHLAERLLAEGHEITILNTYSEEAVGNTSAFADKAHLVWGSVTDPEIVEKIVRGQDVVVHMAARVSVDESIESPSSFLDVNVMGTHNVLWALRKHGGRLIYASSCEVYGSTEGAPVSEMAPLHPQSPYAASKAAADRICFADVKTYGIDATIVRPCNIYGPRQRAGKGGAVIPTFVNRALSQKPLVVFGGGHQLREYMHVDDLVVAYQLVLGRTDLQGEVVNFGSGETISVNEIAGFIATDLDGLVEHGSERAGEVERFTIDSTKAKRLGFVPQVPFWEGLRRYIEAVKAVAVEPARD